MKRLLPILVVLAMIVSLVAAQGGKDATLLAPAAVPERVGEESTDIYPQANGQDKLRVIIEHYAISHPARLRAALKVAPE